MQADSLSDTEADTSTSARTRDTGTYPGVVRSDADRSDVRAAGVVHLEQHHQQVPGVRNSSTVIPLDTA